MTVSGRTHCCLSGDAAHLFVIAILLFGLLFVSIPSAAAADDDRDSPEQETISVNPDFLESVFPFLPFNYAIVKVKTTAPVKVITPTPTPTPVPVKTVQTVAPVVTTLRTIATPTPTPTPAIVLRTQQVTAVPTVAVQRTPVSGVVVTRPLITLPPTTLVVKPGSVSIRCLAPAKNCDGTCIDVTGSQDNCGYCGQRCDAGQHCSNGVCVVDCPTGEANLNSDNNNCGACGNECPDGRECYNGVCVESIPPEYHDCGNGWVSFNDNNHCGACFHQCPEGTQCSNGQCMASCSGAVVDLENDPNNCGACGNVCPYWMCCNGVCLWADELDTNCGACGNVCPEGKSCFNNQCMFECLDADGNKYWLPYLITDNNCGGCGIECGEGSHCEGVCRRDDCAEGFVSSNNVCVPEDDQHCGYYGRICAPGETCNNGYCDCNVDGYIRCNGTCVESASTCNCGRDCHEWETCVDGQCVNKCPNPLESWCGDEAGCKNTAFDQDNCMYCGLHCNGMCFMGNCVSSPFG